MRRPSRTHKGLAALAGAAVVVGLGAGPAEAGVAWKDRRVDLAVTGTGWVTVSGPSVAGYPLVGSRVRLYAVVTNTGDRPTAVGAPITVGFTGENADLGVSPVTTTRSLGAGSTRTIWAGETTVVRPGYTWTTVVVNADGTIPERETANNAQDGDILGVDPSLSTTAEIASSKLVLHHTVGAAPVATVVTSEISGDRTAACFTAKGSVVPSTVRPAGRFSTTATTTARDSWFAETHAASPAVGALQRKASGASSTVTCSSGTTAGYYQWHIDTIGSARSDKTSGAAISTDTEAVDLLYTF